MTREERELQLVKERRALAKALSESFTKPYADAVAKIAKECIAKECIKNKIKEEKKMTEKNVESKA